MLRKSAFFIWVIASLFYAYQYIIRVMPNIMMEELLDQFNITSSVFGQFSGIYYIGYSVMHMPLGIMLDRFGPKKVLPLCILMTSAGLLPITISENWIYPLIGRLLIGIGSSAAILGAFKIIRMGFQEKYFTRMLSISVTIGLMGAIYGGGPVSYLNQTIGHKSLVELFVILGIALAFVTYLFIPNIPTSTSESVSNDLKTVFTNKRVILLCFFAGLMVGPLEGFADVWGAEFLKKIYGFRIIEASYLTSLIFVGMCFGAPVLSYIAEKTNFYLGAIIAASTIMFIVFVLLVMQLLTVSGISIGFVIVGICSAYQIIAIYKASTYVPEYASSLTTAVANMIIMIFGYGFHSSIGYIINLFSKSGKDAYLYGISVIPICLLIGGLGCLTLSISEIQRKRKDKLADLV